MRRAMLLLGILGAAQALGTGVVDARDIDCPPSSGWCSGTNDPDTMYGTYTVDLIDGDGAGDTLYGYDGNDQLVGDSNGDPLLDGPDWLFGGAGDDSLSGYGGSDLLVGGPGKDYIDATERNSTNPGSDAVKGGGGPDEIDAADGSKDTIDCGTGRDTVTFDKGLDKVDGNCERKRPE